MGVPNPKQNLQDWITQQWVILFGSKINADQHGWLLGPFGNTKGIGLKFINQLADTERLLVDRNSKDKGLIRSISQLNLPEEELKGLSKDVIDFYENTANYDFDIKVSWNPLFKGLGRLVKLLFSHRIDQLNVPIENINNSEALTSEIIQLTDVQTSEIKRTIWLRTFKATGQVVYSGVYETCVIPTGQTCIKAIFPLPHGNATVILSPSVGKSGELILESSGNKVGESGFYFLLKDSGGNLWTKFIRAFKDKLVVSSLKDGITAVQTLTLWNMLVLRFEYDIKKKGSIIQ